MDIRKGIYLIADFTLARARSFRQWEQLLTPEVTLVQYRDKSSNTARRLYAAQTLKAACASKNIPLIINDDVQTALAADADGVHLGADDTPLEEARDLLGENKIIGVSCYQSLSRAQAMAKNGADYVAFGSLFRSPIKPESARISTEDFSDYCRRLSLPVCAIGGINAGNIREVFDAGATLAAMIGHIWHSPNPAAALASCIRAVKSP